MLSDVMKHFQLVKEFRNVGYFETAHHKEIFQEIKTAIRQGKLIAVSGIVGSGKTTTLRSSKGYFIPGERDHRSQVHLDRKNQSHTQYSYCRPFL
jgi:type II secretory pathway predicted ATPase ExeA